MLLVTQTCAGLLAAAFAVLTATHDIRLWTVYLLAAALGFVNVFDNPARQTFIAEMVPSRDLPNAVTLNSVSMNLARVFGAALGGVLAAALGLALCFACNALSYIAVLVSLVAMRRSNCSRPGGWPGSQGSSGRGCAMCAGRPSCSSPSS